MSASKKASYVTFVSVLRCYDVPCVFDFGNTRLALMWPFWRGEHPVFWFTYTAAHRAQTRQSLLSFEIWMLLLLVCLLPVGRIPRPPSRMLTLIRPNVSPT